MSAIASFFLIDNGKCDGLVEAANAQTAALKKKRWGVFSPKLPLTPDPFWDYLEKNADELERYPYSGFLLLDVELMAPESLTSEDEVGKRLSAITQSTFITYRPQDVNASLAAIRKAGFSNDKIEEFLIAEDRAAEFPDIAEPIRDSVRRFEQWLGSVTKDRAGLLNIG